MDGKRKKYRTNSAEKMKNMAAAAIAHGISRIQGRFASSMNRCTRHFTARTWKILLLLSAAAWIISCLYIFCSPAKNIDTHHLPVFNNNRARYDSLRLLENIYRQQRTHHRDDTTTVTLPGK